MRNMKKAVRALALALALTVTAPAGLPVSNVMVAEAAAVKLSAAKKTLTAGKSFTLKVTGTKKKVTWKSSKKSVATVNSKGKVTAKKAGTAVISAKVSGKTYKCKVTVKNKAAANTYVAKAPFDAKEVKLNAYTAAAPKDWTLTETTINGFNAYVLSPEKLSENGDMSSVVVTVTPNPGSVQENFDLLKEYLSTELTQEKLQAALGGGAVIKDFAFSEVNINLGKATKISYTLEVEVDGVKRSAKQVIYDIFADGYTTEITITDNGMNAEPSINEVGEYLMNSLVLKK